MQLVILIILNSILCYMLGVIHTEIKIDEESDNNENN